MLHFTHCSTPKRVTSWRGPVFASFLLGQMFPNGLLMTTVNVKLLFRRRSEVFGKNATKISQQDSTKNNKHKNFEVRRQIDGATGYSACPAIARSRNSIYENETAFMNSVYENVALQNCYTSAIYENNTSHVLHSN